MRIVFFILTLIISLELFSQEVDSTQLIIDPVELQAEFPSGMDSLWCFFESTISYNILNSRNLKGKIFTKLVIDTSGKVAQIETNPEFALRFKGTLKDSVIENEIKRVIKSMPQWIPATQMGKKVKMEYIFPIKIPYTDFKCARLSSYSTLCWETDTLADFNLGNGKNKEERINNFIISKLQWPSQDDCYGRVVVQCIVECDGKLSDLKVIRKLCPDFDNEALRVIKLMPNWTPAIKNGRPVRSMVVIPIKFVL